MGRTYKATISISSTNNTGIDESHIAIGGWTVRLPMTSSCCLWFICSLTGEFSFLTENLKVSWFAAASLLWWAQSQYFALGCWRLDASVVCERWATPDGWLWYLLSPQEGGVVQRNSSSVDAITKWLTMSQTSRWWKSKTWNPPAAPPPVSVWLAWVTLTTWVTVQAGDFTYMLCVGPAQPLNLCVITSTAVLEWFEQNWFLRSDNLYLCLITWKINC